MPFQATFQFVNLGGKFALGGKMLTKSGVNGDPTLATREKGELVLTAMAQDIVDFLEEFAKL